MSDLGSKLRAAREAAGVSLAAVAARSHYSKALLGHLETGHRAVRPEHLAAYSRALGVSIDHLYGPSDDPLRVAHEWLVADTPVTVQTSAGRRVGAGLAAELEQRVIELRHVDDVIGGVDLYPLVRKELADAHSVVQEANYSDETGRAAHRRWRTRATRRMGCQRRRPVRRSGARLPLRCHSRQSRR